MPTPVQIQVHVIHASLPNCIQTTQMNAQLVCQCMHVTCLKDQFPEEKVVWGLRKAVPCRSC